MACDPVLRQALAMAAAHGGMEMALDILLLVALLVIWVWYASSAFADLRIADGAVSAPQSDDGGGDDEALAVKDGSFKARGTFVVVTAPDGLLELGLRHC